MERERIPSELMKPSIWLSLSKLSILNTVQYLDEYNVKRSRKAAYDWVRKADLRPASNANPDHIALDDTVIRIDG